MKKKLTFVLSILSIFSLFSCANNEPSNIENLAIQYNGPTKILEGSNIELNALVNGEIDNSNKFIFYKTSNKDIAYVKDSILYTKNVNKDEHIIVTLEDKYTHINSSISLTILDSSYTINNSVDNENYYKDQTIISNDNDFNYFYDVEFDSDFLFKQSFKFNNFNDDSLFGYVLSPKKEINEDSLLISLNKEVSGINVSTYSYDSKSKEFDTLLQRKRYSFDIEENAYFDSTLIKFDQGIKLIFKYLNNEYTTNLIKINTIDFSNFSYCSIYGKNIKLAIKDTTYSFDTKNYIPKPLNIKLNSNSTKTLINKTYQIQYELEGEYLDEELLFSSSDENVATVDNKGLITTKNGGLATISIQFKGTSIIKYFDIYVYRQNEIYNLDGLNNESFFDGPIKEKYYEFKGINDNTYTKTYGFRGTFGIYFYVEQYIKTIKTAGNGWWERDNFEFRITTENNTCNQQYYVSVLNNGSSNIANVKTTGLLNSPGSYYTKYFRAEMFISYDELSYALKEKVNYNTDFGFGIGINDYYGWKCNDGFNTTDLFKLPKIKEDGIYHSIL